jgi:subtilisin family serine protease
MASAPPLPEPFEEAQGGLRSVRAVEAWQAGATGRGVRVAILDTGIDPDNPDLAGQVDFARSASLVPEENLTDLNGHGSHVAGIVAAARNGLGVAGVAPDATLIVVKVLDRDAYGDDFGILQGIRHAADAGAQVINMSLEDRLEWGSPAAGEAAMAFSRAVRYAHRKGALVIAGTGNDAESERTSGYTHLPAALPWVLGVSAVGPVNQRDFDAFAFYSNFGSTLVDVAAPGGGLAFDPQRGPYIADPADLVLSTWSTHALPHEVQGVPFGPAPWSYFAGTSMACAFASGVAALALQAHPEPPQAVASRLMRTARSIGGRNPYVGAGVVDAFQAAVSN